MAESFAELRAAAIDGRTHNIYYRQHQLEALHTALINHASEIKDAIAADYGHSPAEVAVEIHLALSALKQSYETLQPVKAHADEYLLASGSDAPNAKIPAGIAYIEPCTHTLFFSVVAPLSAAIAAGSCAIVLLENNLRTLTRVLRDTLKTALHPDTFAIASSPIRDTAILNTAVHIDQNSSEHFAKANELASPSRSRTFAVVDRTSDIKTAARELVAARFAFGGSSPYAPDLVLVNEFVKQDFLQAVVDESRKLSTSARIYGDAKGKPSGTKSLITALEALKKADSNLHTITQDSNAVILELPTRSPALLRLKTDAPILAVHTIKSLDDAIDFLSSSADEAGPALGAYHFGTPQVGKYLAQFVDARVSFVNHIPRDLLVGPALPVAAIPSSTATARYTVDMFTLPRPAFINPSSTSSEIATLLSSSSAANSSAAQKVLEKALEPLKAMKRKPGGGVGFFEQGFLINAGMILTITISATAAGTVWLVKNGRVPSWGFR